MKKILVWLAVLPFFYACEKSNFTDEVLAESKANGIKKQSIKMQVTRPLKVHFAATPNTALPAVQCLPEQYGQVYLPGGGWISGNATHVGLVDSANSAYVLQSCAFGPLQGEVTTIYTGTITAANGDAYYYTGSIVTAFADGAMQGTITINGGTGRFTNATGTLALNGYADFQTGAATWTGEGTIKF
jgi:hypothetical protein